jgi:hypothetical protein
MRSSRNKWQLLSPLSQSSSPDSSSSTPCAPPGGQRAVDGRGGASASSLGGAGRSGGTSLLRRWRRELPRRGVRATLASSPRTVRVRPAPQAAGSVAALVSRRGGWPVLLPVLRPHWTWAGLARRGSSSGQRALAPRQRRELHHGNYRRTKEDAGGGSGVGGGRDEGVGGWCTREGSVTTL